jgi:hypothetical protein
MNSSVGPGSGQRFFERAAEKKKTEAVELRVTGRRISPETGSHGALPKGVGFYPVSTSHIARIDDTKLSEKESDGASSVSHLEGCVREILGRPAKPKELVLAKKIEDFLSEYQTESKRESPLDWVVVEPEKFGSSEMTIKFNTAKQAHQLPVDSEYVSGVLMTRRPWGSPSLFTKPLSEISDTLVRDMSDQFHHTSFHGYVMGIFAEQSMKETVGEHPFLAKLATVIGAAHDIVQSSGIKNNEFESAHKVMELLSEVPKYHELGPDQKGAVLRLVYHTICSFTTLDFSQLKTFGGI